MSEPRDALIVLLRIIQEIPEDQTAFHEELERLGRDTLVYRSPEARTLTSTWVDVDVIMKKYIPNADPNNEDWKKNCIDIFVGTK
jgi:hypothetical protein